MNFVLIGGGAEGAVRAASPVYTPNVLFCAITDRQRLLPSAAGTPADAEAARRRQLRALLRDWVEGGVDFVQLREKDLAPTDLCSLAGELLAGLACRQSKILINLPASSLAASADGLAALFPLCDGIHLPNKPMAEDAQLVREIFRRHGRDCLVSMSCHCVEEIVTARGAGADLVFYAPVFEKYAPGGDKYALGGLSRSTAQGLAALGRACAAAESMPVFALGGVTAANAADCVGVGSAGVAGIRLFQEGDWRRLRRSSGNRNHI